MVCVLGYRRFQEHTETEGRAVPTAVPALCLSGEVDPTPGSLWDFSQSKGCNIQANTLHVPEGKCTSLRHKHPKVLQMITPVCSYFISGLIGP